MLLFYFLQTTREREDLLYIDLNDKCLQEELQTEKFTILVKCS